MNERKKIAVVLFNLGGPDSLEAVQPFLFNLFNDRAIMSLPQPLRFILAKLISVRRAPVTSEIYKQIGGMSPLLENTSKQARALEKELTGKFEAKCFVAMRYWHPFSRETAGKVKVFNPDQVILLPLYPQFSTTTTASSLADWERAAGRAGLDKPTAAVCCFPGEKTFIRAHVETIRHAVNKLKNRGPVRILFTAHGLPEKIITGGDPYAWQVNQTAAEIIKGLKTKKNDRDYIVCYQSRVGSLKWLAPGIEDEIIRAGKEGKSLVVVPISFVSEHAETLVELDIKYAALASRHKIKHYKRVPALGVEKRFIRALANSVAEAAGRSGLMAQGGKRVCPAEFGGCPCREN